MQKTNSHPNAIWLPEARPMARLRLVVAHHAGGSAAAYFSFAKSFAAAIEVVLVELPGRGSRHSLPFHKNFADAIESVTSGLYSLPNKPTAFFGHSMGALILFEVAKVMARKGDAPLHLFLSAARALSKYQTPPEEPRTDAWLLAKLKENEGTPREILESPEMLDIMIPIFRADYAIIDSYRYLGPAGLNCPISMLCGIDDPGVKQEDLKEWERESTGAFTIIPFEGGHFYTLTHYDKIRRTIQDALGIR